MLALRTKHSHEMRALYLEFCRLNQTVEIDVDNAESTPEQDAAYTAFTAPVVAKFAREREALADQIRAENVSARNS
jgi:hypothetical protein